MLSDCQNLNRLSWSPRKIMVKDLRQRSRLARFCACADSCVVFNTGPYTVLPENSILITANIQSEAGFPSSHQLKSYVASKSRLKLAARAVLTADAGLLVVLGRDVPESGIAFYIPIPSRCKQSIPIPSHSHSQFCDYSQSHPLLMDLFPPPFPFPCSGPKYYEFTSDLCEKKEVC